MTISHSFLQKQLNYKYNSQKSIKYTIHKKYLIKTLLIAENNTKKEQHMPAYKKNMCISPNVTNHVKRDLMGIAQSINPGQPAQSAQSDHGRNFWLLADFLCTMYFIINIHAHSKSHQHKQGPKNFRILTCPPAILPSSYSQTEKDDPFF